MVFGGLRLPTILEFRQCLAYLLLKFSLAAS